MYPGGEKIKYTPLQWYERWNLAKSIVDDENEYHLDRKVRLQRKLIKAQDQRSQEVLEKTKRRSQQLKEAEKKKARAVGEHYTEYIRDLLEKEKREERERLREEARKRAEERKNANQLRDEHGNLISTIGEEDEGDELTPPGKERERRAAQDNGPRNPVDLDDIHYPRYTNIVTNQALPDHVKAVISRTFGPFLANYYVNPNALPIKPKVKHRMQLSTDQCVGKEARELWEALRTKSDAVLRTEDYDESPEAVEAFLAFCRERKLAGASTIPTRMFVRDKDAKDFRVPERVEAEERLKQSILSKKLGAINQDQTKIVTDNHDTRVHFDTDPGSIVGDFHIIRQRQMELERLQKVGRASPGQQPAHDQHSQIQGSSPRVAFEGNRVKFLTEEECREPPRFSQRYRVVVNDNPVKRRAATSQSLDLGERRQPQNVTNATSFSAAPSRNFISTEDPLWQPLSLFALKDYATTERDAHSNTVKYPNVFRLTDSQIIE